jgi:hypothetical protein
MRPKLFGRIKMVRETEILRESETEMVREMRGDEDIRRNMEI